MKLFQVFKIWVPEKGNYLFLLCGCNTFDEETKSGTFSKISLYQIICKNVSQKKILGLQPPFSDLTQFYGLNNFVLKKHNVKINHVTPSESFVNCDVKGRIKVEFFIEYEDLKNFTFSLYSVEDNKEIKDSCIYWFNYKENDFKVSKLSSVVCLVQTKTNGNFVLKSYLSSDNCKKLFLFSSILVCSKCIEKTKYCEIPFSGRIGNLSNDHNLDLNFIFSRNQLILPILKSNNKGETVFISRNVFYKTETVTYDKYFLSDHLINNKISTSIIIRAHRKGFFQVLINLRNLNSKVENEWVAYKVLIDSSNIVLSLPRFPKNPLGFWGLIESNGINTKIYVTKVSNCVQVFEDYSYLNNDKIKSYFGYTGGDEMRLYFNYETLKCVMIKMTLLEKSFCMDEFAIIPKMCSNACTVFLRFPKLGVYSIKLYTKKSIKHQYTLAYIALCYVSKPSRCLQAFPKQFSLWNESSKNLRSILVRYLDRFGRYNICLEVGKFDEKYQVKPYSKILLVDETKKVVPLSKATNCMYEWNYYADSVVQTLSILVLKSTKSDCWSVLLQFDIR